MDRGAELVSECWWFGRAAAEARGRKRGRGRLAAMGKGEGQERSAGVGRIPGEDRCVQGEG